MIAACSPKIDTANLSDEDKETKLVKIDNLSIKKNSSLKSIVKINNIQFKVLSEKITTSSKLLNLKTSNIGSVSGSFIVFSDIKPMPNELELTFNNDAQQIAHKTWKFTANRGIDFLTLYKQLQQRFTKVEMSINYGNNKLEEN